MYKLAIYGKGGIGKSTTASNLPHAGKLLTWELAHEAVSSNLFIGIARE